MLMLCLSWGFNQIAVKLALPDVPPMMQALAIALYGDDVDFGNGLTLDQAMEPNLGLGHDTAGPTTTTS